MGLFNRNSPAVAVPPPPPPLKPGGKDDIVPPPANGNGAAPRTPLVPLPVAPTFLSPQDSQRTQYLQALKVRIHQQLVDRLDVQNLMTLPAETVRNEVRIVIRDLCQSEKGLLNSGDQEKLMDDV